MKKILFLTLIFVASLTTAQENSQQESSKTKSTKSKFLSIGGKIGVPNTVSLNGELVLPILGNHFAPYVDFGSFEVALEDVEAGVSYLEYGLNFYFGTKGKGLYASAGTAMLQNDFTFTNLTFEENGISQKGSATTSLDINSLNLKLGYKTGGFIYFRIEAGYGMGSIPDTIDFTATSNGITETFSEEIPSIPGLSSSGLLIGNIGLGISF